MLQHKISTAITEGRCVILKLVAQIEKGKKKAQPQLQLFATHMDDS